MSRVPAVGQIWRDTDPRLPVERLVTITNIRGWKVMIRNCGRDGSSWIGARTTAVRLSKFGQCDGYEFVSAPLATGES